MIRFFVLVGLIGGVVIAYLTTLGVGEVAQLPPKVSLLEGFREEGYLPESASLEEDHAAEDMEAFEVPEEDAAYLEAAEAAYEKMIGNMDMGNMNMTEGGEAAAGNMNSGEGGENMNMAESGTATTGGEGMNMSPSNAAKMGEGGLLITEEGGFDREITLDMDEWKFSEMKIDVKMGERIKFTVRNAGQIPHEFMFMSPPLMQAASYRATRADWSLLEHEALFEQALVLPGGEFTFVLQVMQPGSWMFMCMLPYHMQLGMMGQMATEGMAMDM